MTLFGVKIAPFPECIGQLILSFSPRNPIRRWFENGLAEIEAQRAEWDAKGARSIAEMNARVDAALRHGLEIRRADKDTTFH